MPTQTPLDTSSPLERAIAQAQQDLAQRLGLSAEQIALVGATSDEFPAANLGCPQEGGTPPAPMPALVSGWRITLRAGERVYEYRARGSELVFCGAR